MTVEDGQGASPAPEDSSGASSPDDVNPEGSSDSRAVPYKRFQEVTWKSREMANELQETQVERDRFRAEAEALRARPAEKEEKPDFEDDPVGHAGWVADQARQETARLKSTVESLTHESARQDSLRMAHDEFDAAMRDFPQLGTKEMRDLAWEQFCITKDRTKGQATGGEILTALDETLSGYAGVTRKAPEDTERRKLRGKPKGEPRDVRRVEKAIQPGDKAPLNKPGYRSLRQKIDSKMGPLNKSILERWRNSEKQTEGL